MPSATSFYPSSAPKNSSSSQPPPSLSGEDAAFVEQRFSKLRSRASPSSRSTTTTENDNFWDGESNNTHNNQQQQRVDVAAAVDPYARNTLGMNSRRHSVSGGNGRRPSAAVAEDYYYGADDDLRPLPSARHNHHHHVSNAHDDDDDDDEPLSPWFAALLTDIAFDTVEEDERERERRRHHSEREGISHASSDSHFSYSAPPPSTFTSLNRRLPSSAVVGHNNNQYNNQWDAVSEANAHWFGLLLCDVRADLAREMEHWGRKNDIRPEEDTREYYHFFSPSTIFTGNGNTTSDNNTDNAVVGGGIGGGCYFDDDDDEADYPMCPHNSLASPEDVDGVSVDVPTVSNTITPQLQQQRRLLAAQQQQNIPSTSMSKANSGSSHPLSRSGGDYNTPSVNHYGPNHRFQGSRQQQYFPTTSRNNDNGRGGGSTNQFHRDPYAATDDKNGRPQQRLRLPTAHTPEIIAFLASKFPNATAKLRQYGGVGLLTRNEVVDEHYVTTPMVVESIGKKPNFASSPTVEFVLKDPSDGTISHYAADFDAADNGADGLSDHFNNVDKRLHKLNHELFRVLLKDRRNFMGFHDVMKADLSSERGACFVECVAAQMRFENRKRRVQGELAVESRRCEEAMAQLRRALALEREAEMMRQIDINNATNNAMRRFSGNRNGISSKYTDDVVSSSDDVVIARRIVNDDDEIEESRRFLLGAMDDDEEDLILISAGDTNTETDDLTMARLRSLATTTTTTTTDDTTNQLLIVNGDGRSFYEYEFYYDRDYDYETINVKKNKDDDDDRYLASPTDADDEAAMMMIRDMMEEDAENALDEALAEMMDDLATDSSSQQMMKNGGGHFVFVKNNNTHSITTAEEETYEYAIDDEEGLRPRNISFVEEIEEEEEVITEEVVETTTTYGYTDGGAIIPSSYAASNGSSDAVASTVAYRDPTTASNQLADCDDCDLLLFVRQYHNRAADKAEAKRQNKQNNQKRQPAAQQLAATIEYRPRCRDASFDEDYYSNQQQNHRTQGSGDDADDDTASWVTFTAKHLPYSFTHEGRNLLRYYPTIVPSVTEGSNNIRRQLIAHPTPYKHHDGQHDGHGHTDANRSFDGRYEPNNHEAFYYAYADGNEEENDNVTIRVWLFNKGQQEALRGRLREEVATLHAERQSEVDRLRLMQIAEADEKYNRLRNEMLQRQWEKYRDLMSPQSQPQLTTTTEQRQQPFLDVATNLFSNESVLGDSEEEIYQRMHDKDVINAARLLSNTTDNSSTFGEDIVGGDESIYHKIGGKPAAAKNAPATYINTNGVAPLPSASSSSAAANKKHNNRNNSTPLRYSASSPLPLAPRPASSTISGYVPVPVSTNNGVPHYQPITSSVVTTQDSASTFAVLSDSTNADVTEDLAAATSPIPRDPTQRQRELPTRTLSANDNYYTSSYTAYAPPSSFYSPSSLLRGGGGGGGAAAGEPAAAAAFVVVSPPTPPSNSPSNKYGAGGKFATAAAAGVVGNSSPIPRPQNGFLSSPPDSDAEAEKQYQRDLAALRYEQRMRLLSPPTARPHNNVLSSPDSDAEAEKQYQRELQAIRCEQQMRLMEDGLLEGGGPLSGAPHRQCDDDDENENAEFLLSPTSARFFRSVNASKVRNRTAEVNNNNNKDNFPLSAGYYEPEYSANDGRPSAPTLLHQRQRRGAISSGGPAAPSGGARRGVGEEDSDRYYEFSTNGGRGYCGSDYDSDRHQSLEAQKMAVAAIYQNHKKNHDHPPNGSNTRNKNGAGNNDDGGMMMTRMKNFNTYNNAEIMAITSAAQRSGLGGAYLASIDCDNYFHDPAEEERETRQLLAEEDWMTIGGANGDGDHNDDGSFISPLSSGDEIGGGGGETNTIQNDTMRNHMRRNAITPPATMMPSDANENGGDDYDAAEEPFANFPYFSSSNPQALKRIPVVIDNDTVRNHMRRNAITPSSNNNSNGGDDDDDDEHPLPVGGAAAEEATMNSCSSTASSNDFLFCNQGNADPEHYRNNKDINNDGDGNEDDDVVYSVGDMYTLGDDGEQRGCAPPPSFSGPEPHHAVVFIGGGGGGSSDGGENEKDDDDEFDDTDDDIELDEGVHPTIPTLSTASRVAKKLKAVAAQNVPSASDDYDDNGDGVDEPSMDDLLLELSRISADIEKRSAPSSAAMLLLVEKDKNKNNMNDDGHDSDSDYDCATNGATTAGPNTRVQSRSHSHVAAGGNHDDDLMFSPDEFHNNNAIDSEHSAAAPVTSSRSAV